MARSSSQVLEGITKTLLLEGGHFLMGHHPDLPPDQRWVAQIEFPGSEYFGFGESPSEACNSMLDQVSGVTSGSQG